MRVLFTAFFLNLFLLSALAQQEYSIRGVIRDQKTHETLPGVSILVSGTTVGMVSDANGTFRITVNINSVKLLMSHVSYNSREIDVIRTTEKFINLGNIDLQPSVIGLDEVHVISSFISDRQTPVAVSTISSKKIEQLIGNHDYPEILKMTPGIYATKTGGGSGDDRLSIRGFQQENISLLLNGVPVSSMENGLVYWSNWNGLTDATEAIQVQRGLGASSVAMNSVGGTVNIITKGIQAEKGGSLRYSLSDYGNQRSILQFSTGRLKGGTAITFLGSRSTGPGYVDATYVNGWAYFLSVSHEINPRHQLIFTAMGSPEHHGQQNYGLSSVEYDTYGNKYNPGWGIYNGRIFNLSENFYHKPQINLNHYWNINPSAFLATSAYVSFGSGGGRYSESFNYGPGAWSFRKNNQIDFDAIYLNNQQNADQFQLANGNIVSGYSRNILTNYLASHYWAGLLSTFRYDLNEKIKLMTGIHVRSFQSRLYEEVDDLMGGQFWIEQYAWSLSGVSGRKQIKYKGDVINVDNSSLMNYGNFFGQMEYATQKTRVFVTSTVSTTTYQRKDPYNYPTSPFSEKVTKPGFDLKTGFSYKVHNQGTVYANLGYYSREPYFKFIYVNYSNEVARGLRNEKIRAAELGYEFQNGRLTARINGYLTYWQDKSLLSKENIQLTDSTQTRSLVKGLDALHTGIESEAALLISRNLSISATLSIGNWKWKNDVLASLYDDNHVLLDSTVIYTKGLYVGDAPQTQAGITVDYSFLEHFNAAGSWVYYDRLYANFDPANRINADDREQPYRIPGYGLLDLFLSYSGKTGNLPFTFQMSCQNLLDNQAITRGDDGAEHDLNTFRGFLAQGRTFNFSMKLSF